MKKNLYIQMAMVAAALITAGCSSDDDAVETAPELRAISFTGDVNTEEAQTSRAEDEGLENYSKQFIVYGYKNDGDETVMNGYNVNWVATSAGTTTSNTHDWEYVGQQLTGGQTQVIKYWDETATNYSFFGYVPTRADEETKPEYYPVVVDLTTTPAKPQIKFSLSYCGEYKVDDEYQYTYFMGYDEDDKPKYATSLTKYGMPLISRLSRITGTNIGKPVRMEFVPPYAKVKIAFERISTVENSPVRTITFKPQPTSYSIPIKADVICSYDLENGTQTVSLDNTVSGSVTGAVFASGIPFDPLSKTVTDPVTGESTLEGTMTDENTIYYANPYYMLFPTTGTPVNFVLQANIGSGLQECVVPAAYMKWEMGYEYTYVFKITKAGLNLINVIKVGIKSWESIGTEETKFHNW